MMRELSLFTGVGGGLLGTELLGFKHIGYVEINDYCQRVITQRIKDEILDEAPIFGDIRSFISEGFAESYKGMVDVVSGGFPCTDISIAWTGEGSAKGLDGERSGLWKETAECLRIIRPSIALFENSPMLTLRGLDRILCDLASMGYDAKWGVVGAAAVGACHVRERMWILAYSHQEGFSRTERLSKNHSENRARRTWIHVPDRQLPYGLSWWESQQAQPPFLGKHDVMAHRMDRIGAIGNGQVPSVVDRAWEILTSTLARPENREG